MIDNLAGIRRQLESRSDSFWAFFHILLRMIKVQSTCKSNLDFALVVWN